MRETGLKLKLFHCCCRQIDLEHIPYFQKWMMKSNKDSSNIFKSKLKNFFVYRLSLTRMGSNIQVGSCSSTKGAIESKKHLLSDRKIGNCLGGLVNEDEITRYSIVLLDNWSAHKQNRFQVTSDRSGCSRRVIFNQNTRFDILFTYMIWKSDLSIRQNCENWLGWCGRSG